MKTRSNADIFEKEASIRYKAYMVGFMIGMTFATITFATLLGLFIWLQGAGK